MPTPRTSRRCAIACGLADDVVLVTTAKDRGVVGTARTKEMAAHVGGHVPGVVGTRADETTAWTTTSRPRATATASPAESEEARPPTPAAQYSRSTR